MNRCSLIGLILNLAGMLGVGILPVVGMAAGYGGPLVWKRPKWAWLGAWGLAWVTSITGAILSFLASGSN